MEDYGSRSALSSYSTASQKFSESQDQESRELQLSCSDYEPGYIPPCPSADYSIQVHKPKASLSPNSILAGRCYCCGPRSPRVATIAWISVAIVFTVVIWSLPILVHCLPHPIQHNVTHNCTSNTTWARTSEECTATVMQSGGVCAKQLSQLQLCVTGHEEDGGVLVGDSNNTELAHQFMKSVVPLLSPGCKPAAIPFVCQYLLPLCDAPGNGSQGELILPSQETCMNISEHTCKSEWLMAKMFGFGNLLPDCDELPNATDAGPFHPVNTTTDFNCSEGFEKVEEDREPVCRALCNGWNQVGDEWTTVITMVQALSISLAVLSSIAVYIVSCVRRKAMWSYPSVYIIFNTTGFFVIGLYFLVANIHPQWLCSNSLVANYSFRNSTTFCTVGGAAFHYFALNSALMWFFHVCTIFYKMTFPITSQKGKKFQLAVHIALTVIGFLVPLPAVIVALVGHSRYRYSVRFFPPQLSICAPNDLDFWFYTLIVPLGFLNGAGIFMLMMVIWLLHKYQKILRRKPLHGIGMNMTLPEIRLIVMFVYYILFGLVILSYNGLTTDIFMEKLRVNFEQYFVCEAYGKSSKEHCNRLHREIERLSVPYLIAVVHVFLGSIPVVNMINVINWKHLWQFCITRMLTYWYIDETAPLSKNVTGTGVSTSSPAINYRTISS